MSSVNGMVRHRPPRYEVYPTPEVETDDGPGGRGMADSSRPPSVKGAARPVGKETALEVWAGLAAGVGRDRGHGWQWL